MKEDISKYIKIYALLGTEETYKLLRYTTEEERNIIKEKLEIARDRKINQRS